MIDFLYNNMEHKLFIILYSILIIYGFYLVLKEKSDIERNIKEKINKRYKTEITLNVDKEEKYILNNINGNAKNLIDDKETYESIKGTLNVILKGNQCKILKVQ